MSHAWSVDPHGPLDPLDDRIWRIEGDLPDMKMKRVMTLAKMDDGGLVIHNGVCLEEPLMARIEAWGAPAFLVVPNGYHRKDAAAFKTRYPDIKILCPTGAHKAVSKVVPVDGHYDALPPDGAVSLRELDGLAGAEGVMEVRHGDSRSLVLNDLIFNMPHQGGLHGMVFRHLTASSGGPTISRVSRLLLIKDRAAVRRELEAMADGPTLDRVIVSHHEMILEAPADTLRDIAATL